MRNCAGSETFPGGFAIQYPKLHDFWLGASWVPQSSVRQCYSRGGFERTLLVSPAGRNPVAMLLHTTWKQGSQECIPQATLHPRLHPSSQNLPLEFHYGLQCKACCTRTLSSVPQTRGPSPRDFNEHRAGLLHIFLSALQTSIAPCSQRILNNSRYTPLLNVSAGPCLVGDTMHKCLIQCLKHRKWLDNWRGSLESLSLLPNSLQNSGM